MQKTQKMYLRFLLLSSYKWCLLLLTTLFSFLFFSCNQNSNSPEFLSQWESIKSELEVANNNSNDKKSLEILDGALNQFEGKHDSLYFYVLIKKIRVLKNMEDYDNALVVANKAKEFAERKGNKIFLSDALNGFGNIYARQSKIVEAIKYYKESIKWAVESKDLLSEGLARNNYATCLEQNGLYGEALGEFNKAIEIFKKLGNEKELARIYGNMGIAYYYQNKKEGTLKSIKLEMESLVIERKLKRPKKEIESLNNLAFYYTETKDYKNAIDVLDEVKNLTDSINYQAYLPSVHNNYLSLYLKKRDYQKASTYAKNFCNYTNQIKEDRMKVELLINLSKIAIGLDDLSKAESLLKETSIITNKFKIPDLNVLLTKSYVDFFKKKGDFALAFQSLNELRAIEKSLTDKERIKAFKREEVRSKLYEVEEQLENSESWINRLSLLLISAFIGIISLLLINRYRKRAYKFKEQILESEKREEEKSKRIIEAEKNNLELENMVLQNLNEDYRKRIEDLKSANEGKLTKEDFEEETICLPVNKKKVITLKLKDIIFLEWDRNYALIHSVNQEIIRIKQPQRFFLEDLSLSHLFFKIHKSFIVHSFHIHDVVNDKVLVKEKDEIKELPIGDKFRKGFLGKYYQNQN